MKRKFTLLIAALALLTMIVQPGRAWGQTRAEEVYSTCLFGSNYNPNNSSYTSSFTATNGDFSWTITNGNNNNNGWTNTAGLGQVKFGRKNNESVGQITTNAAYTEAITKVELTIDAITTSKINSIKLYSGTASTSITTLEGEFSKHTGTQTVAIANPESGKFYDIKFDCASGSSNGLITVSMVKYYYTSGGAPSVVTPTFTPNGASFLDSQEISIACATDGATIYYTTDGNNPSTSSTIYSSPFTVTETTTVKAYAVKENYDDSDIAEATFTKTTALTVAEAIAATPTSGTSDYVYIQGIVSSFYNTSIMGDGSNYRYYISDDGTTTTQLLVYKGNGLNNVPFSNVNDLLVGDEVVIYGSLITYQNAPEVAAGNYLYSLNRPTVSVEAPTFDPVAGSYTTAQNVELSCATANTTIFYTIDGTEPTNASTEYSTAISVENTTTIKAIAYAGNESSTVATANYYICSQNNPYTVTEALGFEDYQYPANGIYVHGIVSTAPTAAPNNGQLTYYISVDGEASNQLQVYKGKGLNNTSFTAQTDIQVGDIVTIYGNVKIYNSTKEFDAGNYLVSFYREPVLATQDVNIACDVTAGVINYTVTNPASDGNLTAAITAGNEGGWLTLGTVDSDIPFTCTANTGAERTATVTLTYTYNSTETVTAEAVVTQAAYVVPTASIVVTPTEVNATADETEGTITVTLTAIEDDNIEIVWFESDGETQATEPAWITAEVNVNNNIDYLIEENTGDARTAYFKVYGLDGDANDVYSELITINQAAPVTPPTPGTWVLTNLADLTANDIFVIVGDNGDTYAMPYNGGGQSGAPAAVAIAIANDALTAEPDAKLQWNISGNATDGYVFYPNGNTESWLYCTATNNGVRVGTNDNKTFVLDSESGYLQNTATSRYVGIYNSQDWRCYTNTTGNISGQTFAFYKKVTGPVPVVPTITVNPAEVTNVPAAGDVLEHTVTLANMTITLTDDFEFVYCDSEGNILGNEDPKPNWIELAEAEYDLDSENVYTMVYAIAENEEITPRTGYFKIVVEQTSGTVYSNLVTVTQEAYVAPVASITVDPVTVNATAAETEGTIIVTYENITTVVAEVYFCDAQGAATTYEWVDAEIDDDDNVYYTIDANTGEARTAYLKVHAFDDDANDVYSDLVTINQAAYVVDYATLPFAYDGNGLGTLPNGLTQEGLTDKYNNSPKMKFDGTGDWLLLHINERPGTLTFNIKGNSFGGDSEFKVQTSADGTNYTDLATYTDLTSTVQSEEFDNLDGNIRYIKWIYTNKDAGNVALGNIALAQYVEPQPSITINPGPYDLNSEGGDAVLPVTYTNMPTDPQAEVIFYESDGETIASYDWITANINGDGNVAGHIDANTGDARSAYFKVKGIDANNSPVYSELVTINQAAYTLSIVFETTSLDIEAGGEQDRVISFEYQGLGESPTFEVRTYDASGETQTTYDWLETSITEVHKVSITVAANTGDARSAYFKVYGENGTVNTESNLVTINQAAAGQTVQYTLITSVDDLTPGYHYLIASEASEGDLNIMDVQNSNNRGVKAATVDEYNTITFTPNAAYYDFVISGDTNNGWTIYDESTTKTGYLYAASSTKNYLRTQSSNDANGIWSITINNEGVATIVAQGSNTRNTMQYNSSNSLFACYSLASESAVYLYKKVGDTNPVYYSPTEIAVADPDPTSEPIIVVNNEILVLTGNLDKCNNPDNLIVEDGGQLVFDGTGVKATMKKKTVGESKAEHWYTIASPVNNIDFANITNLTNAATFDLYRYDEATYTWENYKNTAHTDFVTAENGRGYLYYNSDGNELSFAGELNNSASYDLTASGAQMNGLNLIGNPFTQDITLANISLSDDAQISEGFYVLSNNSDWVASVTTVKPCEGFIVKVNKATKATFSKSTGSSKSRANRDYIAFTVANNQYEDVAYAMFSNGLGLDKINHRNADIPMVYIPQDGQNYAIATMDDNTQAFELNFKAMTTGQYTLSYKAEGKYSYLHVIDRLTGEDIDMLLDGEYSFIGSPRDNEARFIVKLSYNANIDEIEVNDNFAYQNGSDIIVNGNGELQVFDVTGRMVMNTKINGIQTVNVPATGMYIFRMVGESVQTQKIVVR